MAVGGCIINPAGVEPAILRKLGEDVRTTLAVGEPNPLGALLAGAPVDPNDLRPVVGDNGLQALVASGIAASDGRLLSSPLRGHYLHGVVVLSDPDVAEELQHRWYVDPLWEADLLIRLMSQNGGESALDVGCGSGVLSLVLAGRYRSVVGLDVNPRAVALSRLNAGLNGLANVTFREGDVFEPIAGSFSRIVFNSPTNEEGRDFVDLLEAGEPILEAFFRAVPGMLEPGGVVEVNLAMNDYPGDRFRDRLRRWLRLEETGLRVTVVTSQRKATGDGSEWKRGWLVIAPGDAGLIEIDWPYHDQYEEAPESLLNATDTLIAG